MLFIKNKYSKWYFNIILNAQDRITNSYTERHHIIPKSLGGDNSKNNIIRLTAREHFVCHLLLTKMVIGDDRIKMYNSAFLMTSASGNQQRYKINSRTYELLKKLKSTAMIGNTYGSHPMSEETKQKISQAKKGKQNHKLKGSPKTEETKKKLSARLSGRIPWNVGKKWDEATRKKISEARQNTKKLECVHCGKLFDPLNFKKWHGNNCKKYLL